MEALAALADPVRRYVLQVLALGERPAGDVVAAVHGEFGISQPAVSQHLRVLREHGLVTVRAEGTRRVYALDPRPLAAVEAWLADLRRGWEQRLDALGTELARGARSRPDAPSAPPASTGVDVTGTSPRRTA
ncbi:helix-turn-helix transcriptional regulator [Cellulomonas sp. SLBN-39]|uniref:ArsR/SmtB family transcription factor n=1 Tax=Cellulomonas sp. SLBN-39 TaxID=2768446 RepID=UPI001153F988|nr:metalloregulator ArsR/SmtB family transcription factor [Cellulomonas sp. SLBN-39]TQL03573.1 ArsR family transcriptional regulator [Cellulomonas sp. SLBN-39]